MQGDKVPVIPLRRTQDQPTPSHILIAQFLHHLRPKSNGINGGLLRCSENCTPKTENPAQPLSNLIRREEQVLWMAPAALMMTEVSVRLQTAFATSAYFVYFVYFVGGFAWGSYFVGFPIHSEYSSSVSITSTTSGISRRYFAA